METVDRSGAIEKYRSALLRIVAVLFVYAGLDEGGADVLARRVWRRILRILRPAESAVRRLIVIAARGIEVETPRPRAEKPPSAIERLQAAGLLVIREGVNFGLARAPQAQAAAAPKAATPRLPAFPLSDPRRRFDTLAWNGKRPFPRDGLMLADGDEPVAAARLCRRLLALKNALDDLEGHAVRLARWKARRDTGHARRLSPMRPGWPPGRRKRSRHEVDDVLHELHGLALHARKLDTS